MDGVTSDAPLSVDAPVSPSVINKNDDSDDSDDTDDDIFILETASTPKPKKTDLDLSKVEIKQEPIDSNVDMLMECSDDAAVNDDAPDANAAGTGPSETVAAGTSTSPAPPPDVASITTQTEARKIKEESQTEESGGAWQSTSNESGAQLKSDVGVCSTEQKLIKQDSNDDSHSENKGKQTLLNGMNHLDSDEDAGPSCANASDKKSSPPHFGNMAKAQEQQDELLKLMQATAQERDSFKEQVSQLTCQLEDMQSRLQELSQINVKKELSHQANQTEETEDEKDYKSLFEKAKQKVDELIKDKEAFLTAAETKPSTSEEKDIDEIALQVDSLVRELDQRNKERDELRSQVSAPVVFCT